MDYRSRRFSSPCWAALGAVVATLLEGRFQRSHDLRTWRLATADEFTTAAHHSLIGLRSVRNAIFDYGGTRADGQIEIRDPATNQVKPGIRNALDATDGLVDAATSRLGRVHILFGSESDTGKAATETVYKLREIIQALADWPVPDPVAHRQAFDAAQKSHDVFNSAVLVALEAEGSGWTTSRPRRRQPAKDADGAQ